MLLNMLLHITASISIGYYVHRYLYWREMHALVALEDDMCSGIDLIISLAAVGLVLSFL